VVIQKPGSTVEIRMLPSVLRRMVALGFSVLGICDRDCFLHLSHPYSFFDLLDKTDGRDFIMA